MYASTFSISEELIWIGWASDIFSFTLWCAPLHLELTTFLEAFLLHIALNWIFPRVKSQDRLKSFWWPTEFLYVCLRDFFHLTLLLVYTLIMRSVIKYILQFSNLIPVGEDEVKSKETSIFIRRYQIEDLTM